MGRKDFEIEVELEKLDEIIKKLQDGGESLKENLDLYKKGMEICLNCEDELKNAKLEVENFEDALLEE